MAPCIAFSRRYHNAVVEDYNTRIQTVPTLLVAGPLGFERRPFFQADGADRAVPTVAFEPPPTSGTPPPPPGATHDPARTDPL